MGRGVAPRVGMVFAAIATLVLVSQAAATHPRPKGATPIRVSLVPAYQPCTAPDRTHGPPLAFPSCSSPQQVTTRLTVGNPPAAPANMIGSFFMRVHAGAPGPPDDSGAPMTTSITDVRCAAAGGGCAAPGADYAGQLEVRIGMRLSDHYNAIAPGGGTDPATMQDIEISAPVGCVATSDPAVGATCNNFTYLEALYPGVAKDTKRMLLELGAVRILDGGADGNATTDDGAQTFLTQGVFIP